VRESARACVYERESVRMRVCVLIDAQEYVRVDRCIYTRV